MTQRRNVADKALDLDRSISNHLAEALLLNPVVLALLATSWMSASFAFGEAAKTPPGLCGDPTAMKAAKVGLDNLSVSTDAGHPRVVYVKNSIAAKLSVACWMTPSQAEANTTCANVKDKPDKSVQDFSFGYCEPIAGEVEEPKPIDPGATDIDLTKAKTIYVRFAPTGSSSKVEEAVLRIETAVPDHKNFHIAGTATAALDPRYRIDLYTGLALLSSNGGSGKNLSETFPEARMMVESRPLEGYERCREQSNDSGVCNSRGQHQAFPAGRIYGDVGLTSTTAQTSGNSSSSDSSSSLKGAKTFDGTIGAGIGSRFNLWHVAGGDQLTQLSVLAVFHYGLRTLSNDTPTSDGSTPKHTMFGFRLENENGHFAGAYVEAGLGQTDEFTSRKCGRLKVDALVPFTNASTARLVARLQVDSTALVRRSVPSDKRPGQIKIEFLLAIDVKKLFTMFGAATGSSS
jgi:hypothetical protein